MLKYITNKQKMENWSEDNTTVVHIQVSCLRFQTKLDGNRGDEEKSLTYYYYKVPLKPSLNKKANGDKGEAGHGEVDGYEIEVKVIKLHIGLILSQLREKTTKMQQSLLTSSNHTVRDIVNTNEDVVNTEYMGFKKIILSIECMEDLSFMAALTNEIKRIMATNSSKPHLKDEFLKTEQFTTANPYWPSRWFIHVDLKSLARIPSMLWSLQNVESLKLRPSYKSYETPDHVLELNCIRQFKELKYLDIGQLCISELPTSIQLCQKLEEIRLESNKFTALPLFLQKLPKLKTLYRYGNPIFIRSTERKTTITEPEAEDKEELVCGTLKLLCLKSLSTQNVLHLDIDEWAIPHQLKTTFKEFLYLNCFICDHCGRSIEKNKAYQCHVDLDDFCGCKLVPVVGYACSKQCSQKLAEELDGKHESCGETEVPVYHNDDWVMNRKQKLKELQKQQRRERRANMFSSSRWRITDALFCR